MLVLSKLFMFINLSIKVMLPTRSAIWITKIKLFMNVTIINIIINFDGLVLFLYKS